MRTPRCAPSPPVRQRVRRNQRMLPVWPREYAPGCGHTVSPCGSRPTAMVASTAPLVVSMAYTTLSYRPLSHSTRPSALTLPMSGLPPPGIVHVATTCLVAKSSTDTDPSPRGDPGRLLLPRLAMYSFVPSRLG